MSKNGKLLFRNYDPYITSSFGYRIHPITNVKTMHDGVDYGTNNNKLPTYAIEDGKVVKTGYANANGNYVYVNYPRLSKNAIYQHLDRILVKANQSVNKDTIIGYVGQTGQVTGIHLHFGWFNSSEQNKGWYDRNWEDFEKYNYNPPLSYLGSPVSRDLNQNQIEVIIDNLRVRETPNGEILGYIKKGIYTILNSQIEENYTWYEVEPGKWIAYSPEFANLYLKEEIDDNNDENLEKEEKRSLFGRIILIILKIIKKILIFFNIL